MKNYTVKSSSGENLAVNYYEAISPKGLIQILHGMQEHKERYCHFAEFLAANGYSVLIHDHLGHGKSISEVHPLGDMVSFEAVLNDIELVRQSAKFSGQYICFGHSMARSRSYLCGDAPDRYVDSLRHRADTLDNCDIAERTFTLSKVRHSAACDAKNFDGFA